MNDNRVTILTAIKSAVRDFKKALFFDADKEIQRYKDALDGINPKKRKHNEH